MKHQTPEIRFVNRRVLNSVGVAHLLIATAVVPACMGLFFMPFLGVKSGSAIWLGLQLSVLGTALGVFLSFVRGELGRYETSLTRDQRDHDTLELVRSLYRDPTREYFVLGGGTLAARIFAMFASAGAACLLGDVSFTSALGIAMLFQVSPYIPAFATMCLLATLAVKGLVSSAIGGISPMVLGVIPFPDLSQIAVAALIMAGTVLAGPFQRVRYKRDAQDQRELASGSTFYVAHEVNEGWLVNALEFGGGLERARDGIRLATMESVMELESEGWKPIVGDLHSGQIVATRDLVAALREAANADSMRDATVATNVPEHRQEAA